MKKGLSSAPAASPPLRNGVRRQQACFDLIAIGEPAVPLLAEALTSPRRQVRWEVVNALMDWIGERGARDAPAEAVALFCYQVKKWIGGFAAALGGLDTLLFAGGIGENAPTVRAWICGGLGFLGIELEVERNAPYEGVISVAASRATVRVIPTDEEQIRARSVCRALWGGMVSEKSTTKGA